MKFRFLTVVAAAALLAACSSEPTTTAQNTDGGKVVAPQAVPAKPAAPSIVPGSQADFVANVGDRVFFGFDKSDLTAESKAQLDKWVAFLAKYPADKLSVSGHADERGTEEYNQALGAKRADAVKGYLLAKGVVAARLSTISYGKTKPAVPGSNDDAWAKNRRAEGEIK